MKCLAIPSRVCWRWAVVVTVATDSGKDGEFFRRALCVHEELAHVTVEVVPQAGAGAT